MTFKRASGAWATPVFQLVQNTIYAVYPNYYLPEIVTFFSQLHSPEHISRDIAAGCVYLLRSGSQMIGTGTIRENHITRVFVASELRGMGYGGQIMDRLEHMIFAGYDTACLDASLPAGRFYEGRGYRTVRHETYPVKNGVILAYEVMEKSRL